MCVWFPCLKISEEKKSDAWIDCRNLCGARAAYKFNARGYKWNMMINWVWLNVRACLPIYLPTCVCVCEQMPMCRFQCLCSFIDNDLTRSEKMKRKTTHKNNHAVTRDKRVINPLKILQINNKLQSKPIIFQQNICNYKPWNEFYCQLAYAIELANYFPGCEVRCANGKKRVSF